MAEIEKFMVPADKLRPISNLNPTLRNLGLLAADLQVETALFEQDGGRIFSLNFGSQTRMDNGTLAADSANKLTADEAHNLLYAPFGAGTRASAQDSWNALRRIIRPSILSAEADENFGTLKAPERRELSSQGNALLDVLESTNELAWVHRERVPVYDHAGMVREAFDIMRNFSIREMNRYWSKAQQIYAQKKPDLAHTFPRFPRSMFNRLEPDEVSEEMSRITGNQPEEYFAALIDVVCANYMGAFSSRSSDSLIYIHMRDLPVPCEEIFEVEVGEVYIPGRKPGTKVTPPIRPEVHHVAFRTTDDIYDAVPRLEYVLDSNGQRELVFNDPKDVDDPFSYTVSRHSTALGILVAASVSNKIEPAVYRELFPAKAHAMAVLLRSLIADPGQVLDNNPLISLIESTVRSS